MSRATRGCRDSAAAWWRGGGPADTAATINLIARPPRASAPIADLRTNSGPNVLIVILDTVRAAEPQRLPDAGPHQPQSRALGARGVRFTMAQSTAPWTLPSHGSLFTGREAHELSTDWYVPLDERDPTLAEVLSRHGYLTAGFVANLPYTNREVGLARGFQRYEDWRVSFRQLLVSSMLVRAVTTNERLRELVGTRELIVRKKAPEVNRRFLRWLDRRPSRPFFAFLNYYDAHTPFVPPEPYRSRFAPPGAPFHSDLPLRDEDVPWDPSLIEGARNAYDGAIAALDASIGELFDALDQRRLLDSTIVILTSDHGEELAEHGLFSHGNSLYLPSLHVPMIVWQPGGPAGTSVETPVSIRDVPATVLDLAGLGELERMPGRSLRRYWTGDSTPTEPLFTEVRHAPKLPAWYPSTKGDLLGAQEGWLRLIRNGDGAIEVYDIARDPLEQHDLAGDSTLAAPIQRLRRLVDEARR
ncbi:MAG: sulfatase [Gemmatimonadales bacterium]